MSMANVSMSTASATLRGKRAIVTGGGSGIGRGIAQALAQAGAEVLVTGRRLTNLQRTADEIRASGGRCEVLAMDVTKREMVESSIERIGKELRGLDILVNNAGVGGPNECAVPGPDRWDIVIRTNLDGMYFCTLAALRHFTDHGRVINISSVLGKFGVPGYTAYCASKHGVIGFTKALALECAPRQITVNAICPGWVETEMARAGFEGIAAASNVSPEEARKQALAQVPLGRIVQPEEVGALAAYLCSPAAGAVTGQAWSICGGSTMG